jgi:hypothetical protein
LRTLIDQIEAFGRFCRSHGCDAITDNLDMTSVGRGSGAVNNQTVLYQRVSHWPGVLPRKYSVSSMLDTIFKMPESMSGL